MLPAKFHIHKLLLLSENLYGKHRVILILVSETDISVGYRFHCFGNNPYQPLAK